MSDVQELARKVLETGAIEVLPGWARCCVAGSGGAYVVGKVDGNALYGCEFTDFEIAAICWECLKWLVEHRLDEEREVFRYAGVWVSKNEVLGWKMFMGDYQCDSETAILTAFLSAYEKADPPKPEPEPEPEPELTLEERVARLERGIEE